MDNKRCSSHCSLCDFCPPSPLPSFARHADANNLTVLTAGLFAESANLSRVFLRTNQLTALSTEIFTRNLKLTEVYVWRDCSSVPVTHKIVFAQAP